MSYLGEIARSRGHLEEAWQLELHALDVLYKTPGERSPELAEGLSNVGKLHMDQRKYEEAESCFQRALAIRE